MKIKFYLWHFLDCKKNFWMGEKLENEVVRPDTSPKSADSNQMWSTFDFQNDW